MMLRPTETPEVIIYFDIIIKKAAKINKLFSMLIWNIFRVFCENIEKNYRKYQFQILEEKTI